jgi:predicted nucleic acid-binding protein
MLYLVDSNVLLRLVQKVDPLYGQTWRAMSRLRARGDELAVTSQIVGEFWWVCTRPPAARGGFGLSVARTEQLTRLIERRCKLLPEHPGSHAIWRQLLVAHAVSGVQVHDARIAAAMWAHGLTHLLTLNGTDFARYGLTVVDPRHV